MPGTGNHHRSRYLQRRKSTTSVSGVDEEMALELMSRVVSRSGRARPDWLSRPPRSPRAPKAEPKTTEHRPNPSPGRVGRMFEGSPLLCQPVGIPLRRGAHFMPCGGRPCIATNLPRVAHWTENVKRRDEGRVRRIGARSPPATLSPGERTTMVRLPEHGNLRFEARSLRCKKGPTSCPWDLGLSA